MSDASNKEMQQLRRYITENLRIQRDTADPVPYIDVANVLRDVSSRQNHTIFARRGCGKTLLLHHSANLLKERDEFIRTVYLNCEDFKRHSFPNVLIEILDALFLELESRLTAWFGRKKRSRDLIRGIRAELGKLKSSPDETQEAIKQSTAREAGSSKEGGFSGGKEGVGNVKASASSTIHSRDETERSFTFYKNKLRDLDSMLPHLKSQIREFFALSNDVKSVFIQVDDLYHLKKSDQPYVVDYIHRLCKDLPLYFKIATLRHASTLYTNREGQPIGAQERHDYQPINIDYTFADFGRTRDHNKQIFYEFGKTAGLSRTQIDGLFKGEGFDRLVMAGGGVPRHVIAVP